MHRLRLDIEDKVFDKVIYFLQNLPKDDIEIIEEISFDKKNKSKDNNDIVMFSNHSANTIKEWKDQSEDEIWK